MDRSRNSWVGMSFSWRWTIYCESSSSWTKCYVVGVASSSKTRWSFFSFSFLFFSKYVSREGLDPWSTLFSLTAVRFPPSPFSKVGNSRLHITRFSYSTFFTVVYRRVGEGVVAQLSSTTPCDEYGRRIRYATPNSWIYTWWRKIFLPSLYCIWYLGYAC